MACCNSGLIDSGCMVNFDLDDLFVDMVAVDCWGG